MTRKHFKAIASTIRDLPVSERQRVQIALAFAKMCREFNANFDQTRFMVACEAGVKVANVPTDKV